MCWCFTEERKFSTSWITLTKSKPKMNFPLLSLYLLPVICVLGLVCSQCVFDLSLLPVSASYACDSLTSSCESEYV